MNQPTDHRTTLLRTLGIRAPIVQAPMAGVSTPALAAAELFAALERETRAAIERLQHVLD